MSRLNASIKILVLVGNTLFLFLAIAVALISSTVYSGRLIALNFDSAKRMASFTLFVSVMFIIFSISGCCGAFNQTVRKGICSGRRTLCCHQFLLIAILIMSTVQMEELTRRQHSLEYVINNESLSRSYDSFENRLNKYFNKVYFGTICGAKDRNKFLIEWIDEHCPLRMRTDVCSPSDRNTKICGNSCPERNVSSEVWNLEIDCCPDEDFCTEREIHEACPYFSCRIPILKEVESLIRPSLYVLRILSVLSAAMVVGTCLLICYNPRDDIEIELFKTGVMTEEDIKTVRKLKESSGRSFNYEKGKRIHSINLDQLQKEKDENRLTHPSRRTTTRLTGRIHPEQSSSP